MKPTGQRFLSIYAGVLTAVFAATVLSGFVQAPKKLSLEELTCSASTYASPTAPCGW